jgi:RimJ/RimL family protein N-acetyltransferase
MLSVGRAMLTGPGFQEEHVLNDGTRVTLRHVQPDDAAELKRGFERLSVTSRYRRFLGGVPVLTDEILRYLTCVDGHDHVAIVAVTRATGASAETGIGIGRFIRTAEEPSVAEAAITVVDDMQAKGLGRILSICLARAGLERGVRRFRGEILANNQPVQQLLDEVGAEVRRSDTDSLVFEVDFGPPQRQPFEDVVRGLLRAASSHLVGLIRGLTPPPR